VAWTLHYGDVLAGLLPQLAIGRTIGRNATVGAEAIMDPTKRRIFNRSKLVRHVRTMIPLPKGSARLLGARHHQRGWSWGVGGGGWGDLS
jgi:hypothetical protein